MTKPASADRQSLVANGLFIVILLTAAFLRLYQLDEIPPGMTHDEADTGYFVEAVYRTGRLSPVQTPYGYAYKPFTPCSAAPFMALFGPNDLALRVHAVFWSLVLLTFTYLWVRRAFGVWAGLGSAATIATTFWTVWDGRVALNSGPAPALFTGGVFVLWIALEHKEAKRRWWAWALFSLMLTGSIYAYEAAGAAALAFGPFLLYLLIFNRPRFGRHVIWLAGALVIAGLLVAPHLLDPSSWGRTNTLSDPIREATQGNLGPLMDNVLSTLGTFSISGDSFPTYNLPGRPIFDPVVSLFFYGGVLLCIRRWRRPAYAFALMWLIAGILPSLLLGEWTSTLHSKAAQTPILMLPALCAVEIGRFIAARCGRRWLKAFAAFCAVWLVVVSASTGYDYFIRWGRSPEVRAAYFHNMVAIADYLDDTEYSGAVALSSPFPDLPLDPFIVDMRTGRDDLQVRWSDGRRAIVFPDTTHSLFIVPPNAPLDPAFASKLELQPIERVELHPEDVDPYFDVYTWNPAAALSRFVETSAGRVTAGGESLPVDFGGAVELLAYDLPTPEAAPGEAVTLLTVWHIRDPGELGPVPETAYGPHAALFVHAIDPAGNNVGQEDRLDAPPWNWRAGDSFVQLHQIQIPADASSGDYDLAIGIYNKHDAKRLPVMIEGIEAGDHILLAGLEVTSQ
jgi:4-amino-4-deoxy-L-arabinose transferase-like glycosyltransferase